MSSPVGPNVQRKGHVRKLSGSDDTALRKCTVEAFEGGPLRGPFTPQEVSELLGPLWLHVPRFLVKNDRAVDDGSIYGQNCTVAPG